MFIQIVTSLFERMENLLGLPRDLRVGTHGRVHNGLLSDKNFVAILQVIIQKEEVELGQPVQPGRPLKKGLDGIKTLRSSMKKAMQLFKDNISP
jgi:hypothetical protein